MPEDYAQSNPDDGLPTSSGGNDEATQHTDGNAETAAPQAAIPAETFTPGDNATQDTSKTVIDEIIEVLGKRGGHDHFANVAHDCAEKLSGGMACGDTGKAGARWSAEKMDHLRAAHKYLAAAGAACKQGDIAETSKATITEGDVNQEEYQKALGAERAVNAELVKTMGLMSTTLERLSARVEDIARQPMPALTARPTALPDGIGEVSKVDDGRPANHQGTPEKPGISPDEAMKAWQEMSPEQRTLLSIRASYMRPYTERR